MKYPAKADQQLALSSGNPAALSLRVYRLLLTGGDLRVDLDSRVRGNQRLGKLDTLMDGDPRLQKTRNHRQ